MELDLDHWLELLDKNIVHTPQGAYVSVADLKELNEEFKGMKEAEKVKGGPKTLAGAKKAIMQDPEFLKAFEGKLPQAPADAGVVKPVAEKERENEAA